MNCPLCLSQEFKSFYHDHKRGWSYWRCLICALIFRDPSTWLVASEEKWRYEQHENNPEDPRYLDFLRPAVEILHPYLKPGQLGLDFGCGPGPAMDVLFRQEGCEISLYDPHFFPMELLQSHYDFITCTEAFEHFYQPHQELKKISEALKPLGFLVLMTAPFEPTLDWEKWTYRYDPTHVCFLSAPETLDWIDRELPLKFLKREGRVFLFQRR